MLSRPLNYRRWLHYILTSPMKKTDRWSFSHSNMLNLITPWHLFNVFYNSSWMQHKCSLFKKYKPGTEGRRGITDRLTLSQNAVRLWLIAECLMGIEGNVRHAGLCQTHNYSNIKEQRDRVLQCHASVPGLTEHTTPLNTALLIPCWGVFSSHYWTGGI